MTEQADRSELRATFLAERARMPSLCAPLEVEDHVLQCAPEASPPKWHLAHVTWFFETFVLAPFERGFAPFHEAFPRLFNSYYETVGPFHPRLERGHVSRPTVREVLAYREDVDRRVARLLDDAPAATLGEILPRVELGLQHEQQHRELLLMDVKRNFFANPLLPAYRETPRDDAEAAGTPPHRFRPRDEALLEFGHDGPAFAFDNERPRHRRLLHAHALGSRLVTNGEYLEFVRAGGYREPRLWLSLGLDTVRRLDWRAPLYWFERDGEWHEFTLGGARPLDPDEPVCHVSYFEADAYARFVGARLPEEFELEAAADGRAIEGRFAEDGHFHPRPARGANDDQLFGDLWEWTRSSYAAYPGFRPLPGSLGEYNGKFMCGQYVLRGGACVTPRSHLRKTYRNFFHPHERWAFTGIRLAKDP